MCGRITGIARTEITITEIMIKSFGLSEIILSIIRSGLTLEYNYASCFEQYTYHVQFIFDLIY